MSKQFHLQAAEVYESRGMLEKAEREYLVAGESSSPAIQRQALNGLRRLQALSRSKELQLGLLYESQEQWLEAETHFIEAAKNAQSTTIREDALNGVRRVRSAQHSTLNRVLQCTDPLLILGRLLARVLLASGIMLVLFVLGFAVYHKFPAMDIYPFQGDKKLAEHLSVAFPAVRARVLSLTSSTPIFLPEIVDTVYPFVSPRLDRLLPQEAFEIAGVKVPSLGLFVKLLARPRFEVNGGTLRLTNFHLAYAEVWRRRAWFASRLATTVTRQIPNNERQNVELENFVYDVYVRTYATLQR